MTTRILTAAITGVCLTLSLPAQLSGNYTIDPSGSGTRNYTSFQSAVFDLWKQGMSAGVTFMVAPGTYNENVALVPITGMSAITPLAFVSKEKHKAILRGASSPTFRVTLSSATTPVRGLVLDGFKFDTGSHGFVAESPATNVELANCWFTSDLTRYGIYGAATGWKVHHCKFDSSVKGVVPQLNGWLEKCDGVEFHHNSLTTSNTDGFTIASTSTASGAKPTLIYNNEFKGAGRGDDLVLGTSAYGVEVVHNTFHSASSVGGGLRLAGHFTRPHKVANNVFFNSYPNSGTNRGNAVYVHAISRYDYKMDGNLYYAAGPSGVIVRHYKSGTGFATLSAWQTATQQDKNSVQGDPKIVSATDLHLKPGSPAVGKAVNTPSYVIDDFDGRPRGTKPDIGAYQLHVPVVIFGKGCPGALGYVPQLQAFGSPTIGSTDFQLLMTKANGSSPGVFLAAGASNRTWGGIPLPIALGGGCNLLVAPHALLRFAVGGLPNPGQGFTTVKFTIPNDPKLLGTVVHFQEGVIDPAAKGIGVAFSNGITLKL